MHIKPRALLILVGPFVLLIVAAYIQWAVAGLPFIPPLPPETTEAATQPFGFPLWICATHYVNLLFMILLVRSGLQILMDHPRLYWNVHCTPGSEWIRFTPVIVPRDRVWTAKQDSRYLTPWIGLPGYKHTVGMARHWHFFSVLFWVTNGVVYVILLCTNPHWHRLIPTSWQIIPEAWSYWVHYITIHFPPEPNGYFSYNPLQKLAYFAVVFVLAPLAILTGPSMSPALTNRFRWYPQLPGNRQIGRSIHFLLMVAFVGFTIVHVALVIATGFARNMNHIVLGSNAANRLGMDIGLGGLAILFAVNVFANWMAWRHPRTVQHIAKSMITPVMALLLNRAAPRAEFRREDISPFFWPNGLVPTSAEWKHLFATGFKDYRLKVWGLVEKPVELSLADLRAQGKHAHITLHHCIQGWSGIAEWGGLPVGKLIDLVRPKPEARAVVFYSFGEGLEGGDFYDSLPMKNAVHSQTLLAYEMNGEPLGEQHGAPLRLRVENQLGFKMVKWIRGIEFVAAIKTVGEGEGGYNEDHEYFGELANI